MIAAPPVKKSLSYCKKALNDSSKDVPLKDINSKENISPYHYSLHLQVWRNVINSTPLGFYVSALISSICSDIFLQARSTHQD